ncbi:PREDICTED: tRNA (adenine(58)-N(1))-methyltransferase non-catalytic subunit TRM6 isoform X3 [Chinchilla lanigera]|uniref:tRNA (adenine(58)-N(1))-methyltransferase non-catalytic subunit TRM6 isoform X3 n=1 Tax=Chinchilla lanigera TaxID=34839 RepID=UPI0006990FBD|nr:PREDICTED: tRNA (adenine(58)-N(1))-methyltransferase non-catalytic subunit TRM6 isoform X3 [Chinchilla lanigera]
MLYACGGQDGAAADLTIEDVTIAWSSTMTSKAVRTRTRRGLPPGKGFYRKVTFEKQWFYLDNVIGHSYGTTFEVTGGGSLQPKKKKEEPTSETKEAGTDNRNIIDDGKSQKLTQDDIKALKDKGIKGEEIVQQLIENSTTFRDKTEFAQDKYIKKKKKKYEAIVTILKPSTRILSIMYYAREPGKINHMRYDTLAQMLTLGNIRAGNKMIVMETCSGLVLGAMMERMGGFGSIIQLYPGDGPVRVATACFGFPKSFLSGLYEFPLNKVDSLLNGTFSAEMLSSELKDSTSVKESNGVVEDKQTPEQDTEEPTAEAPESSQPEEQETMEVVAQDPEYKGPKERGSRKDYLNRSKSFPSHSTAAGFTGLCGPITAVRGLLSVQRAFVGMLHKTSGEGRSHQPPAVGNLAPKLPGVAR